MTNELSPTARALLDAARDGLAPDATALRRVRDKVDSAVAGGGVGSALAVKLSIVVAALAIVGGAIALRGDTRATTAPMLQLEAPAIVETREVRTHEDPPPAPHIEMEVPAARVARVVIEPPRASTSPPPLAAPADVTLAREVELVDDAMAALRKGDASAALASVRVHREETRGKGQLAEDASAIEIEALCRLRDRRVVAKLEAFDARWPESAQRSRLTTTCP